MCGLPFSGKTYLSKKIAEKLSIERISYDELWNEIHAKETRDPSWEELCSIAEARIRDELKADRSVVYDTLNDTKGNRDKLRVIAKDVGGEAIVVYTKASRELIEKRRTESKNTGERHIVSEDNFIQAFDRFEEPVGDEVMMVRPSEEDIDAWLDQFQKFAAWRSGMPQIIKDVGFDFSWDSKKVWALDEPVVEMDINELVWHFDIPFWEVKDTDDYNLSAWKVIKDPENEIHSEHWKKIGAADLKYPIDIMENKGRWLILDGLHRLVKAYTQGRKTVSVRKIPRSRISHIQK